jgi:2-oxoglutarate dehydrogenase E1 component
MTPKSLLRHPRCVSKLEELAGGSFQTVLDDTGVDALRVRRVVLMSGKLYYDVVQEREKRGATDVALVRLEQLYPFPGEEIAHALARYPAGAELVWAQEEPRNMGAWRFVREAFLDGEVDAGGRQPRYVGREASASPAPGSHKLHVLEQEGIVRDCLA